MIRKTKFLSSIIILFFLTANFTSLLLSVDTDSSENTRIFMPYEGSIFMPDYLGRIDSISYGNNGKTIVLIRDIHSDYQGQKNISKILSYLHDKYDMNECFVEGLDKDLDLSPISSFPFKSSRETVAENYLKSAKISGEEYLETISPEKYTISGMEDNTLYERNLSVFQQIASKNSLALEALEKIKIDCVTNTKIRKKKLF